MFRILPTTERKKSKKHHAYAAVRLCRGQVWSKQLLQTGKEAGGCSFLLEDLSKQVVSCLKKTTNRRPNLCEALSATREHVSVRRVQEDPISKRQPI